MRVSGDYSSYLHKYEAIRIPKESDVLKGQNTDAIKEDGSVLVLTDEAKNNLFKIG